MFTRKDQFPTKPFSQEKYVNQCVTQECQAETSKWKYPVHVINHLCDDKTCQVSRYVHMQPVKPAKKSNNLCLVEPAIQSSCKRLCSDKNCQSTRSFKKMNQVCGEEKNCQCTQCMWPVKSASQMQSMTKPMWSVRRLNMLQTSNQKCIYEEGQFRPECDDKNCQFAKPICYVKSEGTQSSYMQSVTKTASNQIGTQPEVASNCTDYKSKSCYQSDTIKCLQFQDCTRNILSIKKIQVVQRCNCHRRGQRTKGRCNLTTCNQHKSNSI